MFKKFTPSSPPASKSLQIRSECVVTAGVSVFQTLQSALRLIHGCISISCRLLLSLWSLHVLSMFARVFSRCFRLPHHQNMHARFISSQSWTLGAALWLPTAPQGRVKCREHISLKALRHMGQYMQFTDDLEFK